jgi:hypothetical protein
MPMQALYHVDAMMTYKEKFLATFCAHRYPPTLQAKIAEVSLTMCRPSTPVSNPFELTLLA